MFTWLVTLVIPHCVNSRVLSFQVYDLSYLVISLCIHLIRFATMWTGDIWAACPDDSFGRVATRNSEVLGLNPAGPDVCHRSCVYS